MARSGRKEKLNPVSRICKTISFRPPKPGASNLDSIGGEKGGIEEEREGGRGWELAEGSRSQGHQEVVEGGCMWKRLSDRG